METYKDLLNGLPGAAIVTVGTRVIFVNNAFLKTFGFVKEPELPQPLSSFVLAEDLNTVQSKLEAVSHSDPALSFHFRFKRNDGSLRIADASSTPINLSGEKAAVTVFTDVTEVKKAESEHLRLTAIVDSASDCMSTTSMDGTILTWNEGGVQTYGYTPAEAIGQNISIIHPSDVAGPGNIIDLIKGGQKFEQEAIRKKKDGTLITVSVKVWAIFDSDGNPIAIAATSRDVTEKKGIEKQLQRRTEELEALLRIATILAQSGSLESRATLAISVLKEIAEADRVTLRLKSEGSTDLVLLAEVGTKMIGGTPRILDGNRPTVPGIAVREDRTVVVNDTSSRAEFSAALSGAGIRAQIGLVIKASGRIVGSLAIASGEVNHFTPDRIVLLEAVASGIGALLENARLGDNLAHSAAIVESSNDAIFRTDLDGTILSWNPGAVRIYGYSAQEAIGKSVTMLMTPDRQANMEQTLNNLKAGNSIKDARRIQIRKDGVKIDMIVSLSPIRDESGKVVGISSINADISDLVALESQLRQAQKMEAIGRLSGGVAHDFNNFLTPILGFSELGLQTSPAKSNEHLYFEEILKAAERSRDITKKLLSFSSQRPVEQTVFTMNELVMSSLGMLRTLVGEGVQLTTSLSQNVWPIKADMTAVQQVLVNLVANAKDAMPKGGPISVGTANVTIGPAKTDSGLEPGEYSVLTVSDLGQGMSDEVKAHLFEPFFTTKEKGKGTGLGLATSYGIVKASGGHIVVESEVGLGTKVRAYFPRTEAAEPVHVEQTQEIPTGFENILLVEDEESVRKVTNQILQKLGYKVFEAKNGLEAWHVFNENPSRFDFVLTDVVMPVMDGMELAHELQRSNPELKILLMSGYMDVPATRIDAMTKTPDLIQKPFTTRALAVKIRQVIARA